MASNGDKDPIANLTEKLRGLFGFGDHPKNNDTLPQKRRFSIWFFLLAMLFFSYLQPVAPQLAVSPDEGLRVSIDGQDQPSTRVISNIVVGL